MGKLVPAATFMDLSMAYIARSKLEAEGIPCFLVNEYIAGTQWMYTHAVGGVGLLVPESCATLALELLTEDLTPESIGPDDDELTPDIKEGLFMPEEACPSCNGLDVKRNSLRRPFMLLMAFVGLPLLFDVRWQRCRKCGHRWR